MSMDDLISRQAAIDALNCNVQIRGEENAEAVKKMLSRFYENIMAIPSAQQWIPCSERLPDDDRTKIVTLANGNAEAGYYSNGDWWCIGDTISLENPTVIAWMPLPKPYEVEK